MRMKKRSDDEFSAFLDASDAFLADPFSPDIHIRDIVLDVAWDVYRKYMEGQRRRGTHLWQEECLSKAWEEVLDLICYLHVVRSHLRAIGHLAELGRASADAREKDHALTAIANIVATGNPWGNQAVNNSRKRGARKPQR